MGVNEQNIKTLAEEAQKQRAQVVQLERIVGQLQTQLTNQKLELDSLRQDFMIHKFSGGIGSTV